MPDTTLTANLPTADEDLIPEDDRPAIIKVDHVSMVFNMASEKLGSLKEYVIALAKRKLFFESFTALDDISLEVKRGDVYGILGTNGSGKSTLLKIIAGVLEPTKGNVSIEGNIAPLIELGAGFDLELSARENIFLNGALLGYSRAFIQDHFNDIVEFAEIEQFLDMPMKNYSSGMVSRIAFAIATVIIPDILIVDEVLAVGDFIFQQKCEDRISELIEKHGVTVLIVSHSNDQIERLCNKAVWIEKGHMRAKGTATEVCNIYRALGGRGGSAESERIVFDAMKKAESCSEPPIPYETIPGMSAAEINANMAIIGWKAEECHSALLVPYFAHSFAISVSGIAGALNAPILPYGPNGIDPSTFAALLTLAPDSVYVLGTEDEFDSVCKSAHRLKTASDLIHIPRVDDLAQNEAGIIDFGNQEQLLKDDCCFICSFADVFDAFAIAPIAYLNHVPVVVLEPGKEGSHTLQADALKRLGANEAVLVGSLCTEGLTKQLQGEGFDVTQWRSPLKSTHPDHLSLAIPDNSKICVGSGQISHWMELRGTPALCGKLGYHLIFEDTTSLDTKAECIRYVAESRPSQLLFLNSSDLTEIEKKMLASSVLATSVGQ